MGVVVHHKYRELKASTPTGHLLPPSIFFVETTTYCDKGKGRQPPRGPAVDVFFNFGGGCCRSYRQHPLGAPPSMSSSTSVVAATEATGSTPKGARHRHLLQLQWWLLSELPATPPREPAIDVFFNFGGGSYRSYRHHPPGGQ
jgi:hypothetical protein